MVDPTDKDTEHIRDQSTCTGGYLEHVEYTKEKEKGKVNQLDVGNENTIGLQITGQKVLRLAKTDFWSTYWIFWS